MDHRALDRILLAGVASALMALGCGVGGQSDAVGVERSALGNSYDLESVVAPALLADSRGWEVEWQIPQISNPATGVGVIGQWFYNLETGLYHTGDGWWVYYYGDDNGTTGNNPNCDSTQWGTGGACHGEYENLQPGRRILFHYEYCTTAHVASVSGTQLCVYVDLEDGQGLRFLAEDSRTTVEMYTHDIENVGGAEELQISCASPAIMVRQRRETSAGVWVDMTGASSWKLQATGPSNEFENVQLAATPATWSSCSGAPPASTCSDGIWNGTETGVDCGGSCPACGGTCQTQSLPRAAAVASSQENASLGAAQAIDGNLGTRWSSAFSDPQWIYVDLGSTRYVSQVTLSWETAASKDFDIQLSGSSSGPWTTVNPHVLGVGGSQQVLTFPPAQARYVQMYSHARTTQYGNSLWELSAQGDPNPSCASTGASCVSQALTRVSAVASSQESSSFGAAQAIDGNLNTRWSSAFSDPQWIYVDLGSVQKINRVVLSWETAASASYEIDVSSSSSGPWTTIYDTTSGNGGTDDLSGLSGTGRYVRMYSRARTTSYGNSLWELQVYGDPNPSCVP